MTTIVLDTNVLSELMNAQSARPVEEWMERQSRESLSITTITQAEILYGIAILHEGSRKQNLHQDASALFAESFSGRILPFSQAAAVRYADISSYRRSIGRPIAQLDAQIAAICSVQRAAIATRNVKDFMYCQIDVVNPWQT